MAYAAAECNLKSLHHNWKRTLCIDDTNNYKQTNAALKQLESAVSIYIRKVSPSHNPQDIIKVNIFYTKYHFYVDVILF